MTAVVIRGDARRLPLPDASVDLIVTSPPYFGLRSYTDNVKCYECVQMEYNGRDPGQAWPDYAKHVREVHQQHYAGQIGSEATPAEFLAALWECTREWIRVLKPEGSLFVNLGDKYSTGNSGQSGLAELGKRWAGGGHSDGKAKQRSAAVPGMPPKTLLGLPWRYAIGCIGGGSQLANPRIVKALMRDYAEGRMPLTEAEAMIDYLAATPDAGLSLILRAEIIWAKPNGLPESVTDRVRRSHEQLFHFTRLPRYYAAVDEIRVPHYAPSRKDGGLQNRSYGEAIQFEEGARRWHPKEIAYNALGKLPGSVWEIPSAPLTVPAGLGVDHFAAFPPALVRPVVLGWSPPGVCTACGQGRRPVAAPTADYAAKLAASKSYRAGSQQGWGAHGGSQGGFMWHTGQKSGETSQRTITGYACACPDTTAPTRPSVVLDPFGGTGTTALVASVHGRTGVSVDLSADYCRLARWRTRDPGERARALDVPKPPPVPDGQIGLFDMEVS